MSGSVARKLLQGLAARAFRSRWLARSIFGVRFREIPKEYHYFDATTRFLAPFVRRSLNGAEHVVDMGTGACAVIGLYLRKETGCPVIAVDVDRRIVEAARRNVELNATDVDVRQSRFFDAVPESFHVVVFNPPYVPTAAGLERDLGEVNRSQWDGGIDGMSVIEEFLDALAARTHTATAYLGINGWHVESRRMEAAIARRPTLELEAVHRSRLSPIYACVIRRTGDFSSTKSPSTSASMPLE